MRYLLLFLLLPVFTHAMTGASFPEGSPFRMLFASTYYVSTSGSDTNPGSSVQPWRSWDRCSSVVTAGDIVFIGGGTYLTQKGAAATVHINWNGMTGNSGAYITIQNMPGQFPIFDMSNIGIPTATDPYAAILSGCAYVRIRGLHIRNLAQNRGGTGISRGFDLINSPNCILEQIEVDHIGGGGFHTQASNNALYLNCDSHHNDDRYSGGSAGAWGGADGFSCTGGDGSTNTTYTGCRAWLNSDDGWDNFKTDGFRTWNNCWSFLNGYYQDPGMPIPLHAGDGQGFKLGPLYFSGTPGPDQNTLLRTLNNCLAFDNYDAGFNQNGTPTMLYKLQNCDAFRNRGLGFDFGYYTNSPGNTFTFNNNMGYLNGTFPVKYCGSTSLSHTNTWTGGTSGGSCQLNNALSVVSGSFASLDTTGVTGARGSNGELPVLSFLHLSVGSVLRNAGTDVGLGDDIGAYQYSGAALPVSANAGPDQPITLPTNTVQLNGTGTGTAPIAYQWSGPDGGAISDINIANPTVIFTIAGSYRMVFRVTDGAANVARDTMVVTVSPSGGSIVPTGIVPRSVTLNSQKQAIYSWYAEVTPNSKAFNVMRRSCGNYTLVTTVTAVQGVKEYKGIYAVSNGYNVFYIQPVDHSGSPAASTILEVKKN